MTFNYKLVSMASNYLLLIANLCKCGKPLSSPVEKALKNKKHFSTLFPRGSENMSGFPHLHRLNYNILLAIKIKK